MRVATSLFDARATAKLAVRVMSAHIRLSGENQIPLSNVITAWAIAAYPNTTQGSLEHLTGLTTRAISGSVNHLIENGTVVQSICPKDRRVRRLNLTRKGNRKFKVLYADLKEFRDQLAASLGMLIDEDDEASTAQETTVETGE